MLSLPASCFALLFLAVLAAVRWLVRDSRRVDDLDRKHVLITGCDSGFGNLLARQLDRKGFHVLAACLTEEGAAELSAGTSARLKSLVLDVTDSSSICRAVRFVSAEVGGRGEKDRPRAAGGWTDSTRRRTMRRRRGTSQRKALELIGASWSCTS